MIPNGLYRFAFVLKPSFKCPFCFSKLVKPVNNCNIFLVMKYSDNKKHSLVTNESNAESSSIQTTVKTIKETTKTASYLTILLTGFGIGGIIIYAVLSELFSGKSVNALYSKTFKYVSGDPRVVNIIGDQIKGFGEENRRGRRQHVSHVLYKRGDSDCVRMKFYIKGSRGSGTVHLEMVEVNGQYVYRYLFVIIEDAYQKVVTLEDNRSLYDDVEHSENIKTELNQSLNF